jgi:hypothetical protein
MKFSVYNYLLLGVGPLLQLAGLVAIIRKRLYSELPTFAFYTFYTIVFTWAGLAVSVYSKSETYFYFFWFGNAIAIALGFDVIREVYGNVLNQYSGVRWLANRLFIFVLITLVAAALFSGISSSTKDSTQISNFVVGLEKTVRFAQFGLVVVLFYFARALGLSWRHYTFGIAIGFALFAGVTLIVYGVRSQVGPSAEKSVWFFIPTAYLLATTVWAVYLFRPLPVHKVVTDFSWEQLREWDLAIRRLLGQK